MKIASSKKVLIGNTAQVFAQTAASMTGIHCKSKKEHQIAKWARFFLHRESLATKQISPELHKVVNLAMKTVNYIKENTLYSRFAVVMFERLDADHL